MPFLHEQQAIFQPTDRCRRCYHRIYFSTAKFLFRSLLALSVVLSPLDRIVSAKDRKMRKTRLVILPTKCLHQMGFLLLFLSCPVIGDWGRIRPDSENSHRAIQVDREGTCGFLRDPPGKPLNFLHENGSDQCQLSEDFESNGIIEKPVFREVRRHIKTRVDLHRMTRERNFQEQREVSDERRDVRKAMQRVADERRDTRSELQREVRRNIREISQIRSKNTESRQPSRGVRQEIERATRRQMLVPARRISNNEMNSRNEIERVHQVRKMTEKQNDRRLEQQRRSVRKVRNERREIERATPTEREMRERQTQRLVRSVERERQVVRQEDIRSLRKRETGVTERRVRERNQERQHDRLSLARRELNDSRKTERGRNVENSERRLSQIRKTRNSDTDSVTNRVIEQRVRRSSDNGRNDKRRLTQGNVRERRVAPSIDGMDRMMDIKSARVSALPKYLPEDVTLENKKTEEVSGGITKWMDLKRYESIKAGDWTTNCIIGAAVYFFSTRQIKAV